MSLTPAEKAASGALAAMVANASVYPLDLAKTVIQTQQHDNKEFKNTMDVFKKVYAKRGIPGLYHGLFSSLAGCAVQNFGYFYWYTVVRRVYASWVAKRGGSTSNSTSVELLLGMAAAAISNMFTLPVGVISTKQQTDPQQKSIIGVIQDIYKEDGITGFWAGLKVSQILCINPSITYGVFERLRTVAFQNRKHLKPWESFVAGMVSKTCATIATQPLIISKALLQKKHRSGSGKEAEDGAETGNRKFKTFNEALIYLYQTDGPRGLWKGVLPQLSKGVIVQGLLFSCKDQLDLVFIQLLQWISLQKAGALR
ncbi:hypothetical protein BABINDRAFT_8146 [Babjeviella inositovora NRRL Y-12698]|uniref:Mitochondrial carrier protein n=1 Tax=Babjeviella inositovora NRRL Y-12698 TaxID=984486 RepID=A0A1E3QQP7_9ASCO|nr:uncharacterized protein BABINDRAFT_8146 [Babjeviella inositovora NRRL Y-12698]ODQ79958.1 hypothetical protein BABINDRAFT_8146 [Babjeviella inositovora NRRL Y-12698]